MVGSEVFLMKPKNQYPLSQWGEYVCSAQSSKEMRLLCESVFFLIGKQILIIKEWQKVKFFLWNQSFNIIYPNKENEFMVPNHEKREIIMWIHVYPNWHTDFKKWWEVMFFLWNQSINVIYPNKEIEFMVPNHENKWDYYMNLRLS